VTGGLRVLLILVAAGLLTAVAQSSAAPAPKKQPASSQKAAVAGGGAPATAEKRKRRRRRPGCNKFCRQAGGFGAGPENPKEPVGIPRQTVKVEDGIVAIRAHCRLRHRNCVGAILVDGPNVSYGRANLWIERRDSRLVRVFVPRKARKYLRRHHGDRQVFATVPLRGNRPLSISRRLTLLPDN
jgi:hypothetical protein